jgi:hypothetical protein
LVHPAAQSVPAGQRPGPAGPAGAALIDHACGGRRTERSSHAQRRQQSGRRHPRYPQTRFARRQHPPILDRPAGARRTTRAPLEPRRYNSRLRTPRWTRICSRFHRRAIEAPVPDAVSQTSRAMNDQFLQYVSPITGPHVGNTDSPAPA